MLDFLSPPSLFPSPFLVSCQEGKCTLKMRMRILTQIITTARKIWYKEIMLLFFIP